MLRRLKAAVLLLTCTILFAEIAIRTALSFRIGPDVLWYGIRDCKKAITPQEKELEQWRIRVQQRHNVAVHANQSEGYSKYYPYQKRIDHDRQGAGFRVAINGRGFRGKDFEERKPEGILRIVTLGASSTFGYQNRDDETYPFYLEQILNKNIDRLQCRGVKAVEVINMGIPHLKSQNIYSLFLYEALPLNPDIVTFYEGINDAAGPYIDIYARGGGNDALEIPLVPSENRWRNIARRVSRKMSQRLLSVKLGVGLLEARRRYLEKDYDKYLENKTEKFLENLSLLQKACESRGIRLFVITQQAKSYMINGPRMKGISYDMEAILVASKMAKEPITTHELFFLTHNVLMKALREWAQDNDISFIDGIKALDDRRDCLASWVHLSAPGNYILAEAIAKGLLLNYQCPASGPGL